jgi:photosystem II stability/assembly factor-like uncharacterized protein
MRRAIVTSCLFAALSIGQSVDSFARWEWRNLGPATMGGRISDIDASPTDPNRIYVAAGSGGLFRSINGGTTWASIFDHQSTISIGGIAIDPRNADTVWVGTGEANLRNSVSFGDGVYVTRDGGRTWLNTGLKDTQTISRVLVDPVASDTIYVAAVGHSSGPNPERGVFVSWDAGKSWRKTLYIDDVHGASDLDINPVNPTILYAAMWHFDRKPWTFDSGSEKGGVFRSDDGGRTWKKLTNGLPKVMGRIGVKVAPSNPRVVYVIAESNEGTLFRSDDGGSTFAQVSNNRDLVGRGYYFADMRVDPTDENRIYVLNNNLVVSADAGKTFRRIAQKVHGDLHALWINPRDPRLLWEGHDGGLAVSRDRGETWEQVNNLSLAQDYRVSADSRIPFYNVTAGTQDNGTWTGPSRTREPLGILNDDWRMINGVVGFESLTDPDDPDVLVTEQPGGVLLRTDLRTREQHQVGPQLRTNSGGNASGLKYRFSWDAPLVRSPYGKNTVYLAGNVVFQSSDLGKSWEPISKDLTSNDKSKMKDAGGPVWIENSADVVYGTITALAESPVKRGVIWAGTDDGNLQTTPDGGRTWTNVATNLKGVPAGSPISHVEISRAAEGTVYVSLDRHMLDDLRPYIFKTVDNGKTWSNISGNLPAKDWVWTVVEDPRNPRLLYAGTETGLWITWDGGGEWRPLQLANLPASVAVRDIFVHPSQNDLLIATHGRGIWVLDDVTSLQQMDAAVAREAMHLFPVRPSFRYSLRATRFGIGDKAFSAPNPAYGALITYHLGSEGTAKNAKIEILDFRGLVVRELKDLPHAQGWNRVAWDLRYEGGRPQALPGTYRVRLSVDGKSMEQPVQVVLDPEIHTSQEDLALQFEYSTRVRDLQARVNAEVTRLDTLIAKTEKADPSLAALLKQRDVFTRPRGANRAETGPRLIDQIETLAGLLDAANAAPTQEMIAFYGELNSAVSAGVH